MCGIHLWTNSVCEKVCLVFEISGNRVDLLVVSLADHPLSVKQVAVKAALQKRQSNGESRLLVFVDDVHVKVQDGDAQCMWLLEMNNQLLLNALFLSSDPAAYTHLSSRKLVVLPLVTLHVHFV
jgi:hypothetical protein